MPRRSTGPHRRAGARRPRHVALGTALALLLATLAAAASSTAASASPQTDLASATAQAQQLQAQIDANSQRADILDEQYLQAQAAIASTNTQIGATQRSIATAEARAQTLHRQLGDRAALLYMGAGNTDPIGMDAATFQDLGSRAKYSEAAAAKDSQILGDLKVTEEQLRSQRQDLQRQLSVAQGQQRAAQKARAEVAAANASMQTLLASTKANIRTLAAQIEQQRLAAQAAAEQARLRQLAAQQAAQAAQAAANAAARQSGGGGGGGSGGGGGGSYVPVNIPAPSAGAAAAVAYAYAQLGKPYQYAGVGPDSFDCSGLTMMAWAQAGVGMAHGSQAQYDSFPHVPIDQLQPGDLVFFGSSGPSNHHVGIVVGGGMMIDAPHTGAYVEKVSYYRPDLVSMGARP